MLVRIGSEHTKTLSPFDRIKLSPYNTGKPCPLIRQTHQAIHLIKYSETKPATLTGIEKYLGSGLIKGVGPVVAKRIVAHFALDTKVQQLSTHRSYLSRV
jgi:ATP-dependent exoDNAse (exonuclease V) alpha subunit